MNKRMWGPVPDVREVEAHHKRCGGGGCYAPWLVRESAAEVLGVVRLTVNRPGTPDEAVESLCGDVEFVEGRSYQWCALSHDGTPMPRIDAAAPSADDICNDFAARMRGSYPDCFVGYEDDVLHVYTGTPGLGRPIPESYLGHRVHVHLGVWPMPATQEGG